MNSKLADEESAGESPATHNQDVARGLREYCHFPYSQGFAVMLSGPWGSGKTHFIKAMLDDLVPIGKDRKANKPLYVSLYGVKEPSEIGDQLFQQLHPFLTHKATRLVGAVMRAAAKATVRVDLGHAVQASGVLPDLDLSSILGGTDARTIIFDDFERAAMTPIALLGYINPLVEHDGCKVIILSDESKFTGQNDYYERKEKTVGRTFEYIVDASEAYLAFMNLIDDRDARSFFTKSRDTVLNVFIDSELGNLRLLKQFLWDFERFWKTLTRGQRENVQAMQELVALLCASAIELRSGRLSPETFRRNDILHHLRLEADKPDAAAVAVQEVFKRYPTVQFDSTLLERKTIVDLVLKSKLPMLQIQRELKRHPYFAKPEEMSSWRALWLSSEASREQHDAIVRRFDEDFDHHVFRMEAEIYQVIGLSLWLSNMGFPNWAENSVVEKMERYINEIYCGTATADDMGTSTLGLSMGGAFGLGYMNMQDPRFVALASFAAQQKASWQVRSYPVIANDLHRLMTEDSEFFLREVCFTSVGPARFARLGVLKYIQASEFAATIADARYRDQSEIMMALSIRYQQVAAEPELEAEIPWLKEVRQHLEVISVRLPRIAQFHLSNLIRQYLDETLTDAARRLGDKTPSRIEDKDEH